MFGLSEDIIQQLQKSLQSTNGLEKVVLFGSRARGDFKPESDIDIAVFGEHITTRDLTELYDRLNALPILYKIDLIHYDTLQNDAFKNIILRDQKRII